MLNRMPVLNHDTWGTHLNFEGYFTFLSTCLDWITSLQQQGWHRQGLVAWYANLHDVAYLYIGHALEQYWILQDKIELAPDQAQNFFDFLITQENR